MELPPDFRRVFEAGPGLFLLLTPDLHILAASDAYLRATLTTREGILGRYVFDVFPDNPGDPTNLGVQTVKESMERAIRTKAPDTLPVQKYDVPQPQSEGGGFAVRYWSPVNAPILGPTGEVVYLLHRVEDVTGFVQSTQGAGPSMPGSPATPRESLDVEMYLRAQEISAALRAAETRFQLLVEGVRDYAIVMLDPAGTVISWNQGAERMMGYSASEIVGQEAGRFFTKEQQDEGRLGAILRVALESGRHEEDGVRVRREGTPFPALVTTTALLEADGTHVGFAQVTRDLSDTRRLEAQLQQKQKLEAIGQLAGGLAHDFNNLLTVIASNVAFAFSEVETDSPVREYLFEIDAAASRAAELTRQLLAFSRRQVISPKVLDLNEILRDLDRMLRRLIGEDVQCRFELAADLGRIRADRGQLEQIVMNLAANARDAMPRGGTFVLKTENVELDAEYVKTHANVEPGSYVMLTARDSGEGMSRETLEHVFEPFFSTKATGQGAGLGLAMVWGIVRQHGGAVWASSEQGQSSTFRVCLPRVDAPVEAVEHSGRRGGVRGGTETILLLDDDHGIRAAVIRLLRRSGYQVLEAPSGPDALQMAKAHDGPLHLLITDVVMPGASGPEVAAAIRAVRSGIKVLFVSGYAANVISQQGLDEAEVAFLEKPFAPNALLTKVREVLDG
jgi:two-component system, cell cycle sensor histidine kinase and response regulator CckA